MLRSAATVAVSNKLADPDPSRSRSSPGRNVAASPNGSKKSEAALRTFTAELTQARTTRGNALAAVRSAAKAVAGAEIDRQAELARQQLNAALVARRRLQGLAAWWPDAGGCIALAPATLEFFTNAPDFGGFRIGTDNGAPAVWTDLLARLIGGDAEAAYEEAPAPATAAA